jgi:hypothetical protein
VYVSPNHKKSFSFLSLFPLELQSTLLVSHISNASHPVVPCPIVFKKVSGSPAHYRGIGHALQRIVVEEGPFGLYNGLGITLLVQVRRRSSLCAF